MRHATGDEIYETFAGEVEHPAQDEIIFADTAGQAHSRRWAYRQSAVSAVSERTNDILIVAEALHDEALPELMTLQSRLKRHAEALQVVIGEGVFLSPENRRFEYAATGTH